MIISIVQSSIARLRKRASIVYIVSLLELSFNMICYLRKKNHKRNWKGNFEGGWGEIFDSGDASLMAMMTMAALQERSTPGQSAKLRDSVSICFR